MESPGISGRSKSALEMMPCKYVRKLDGLYKKGHLPWGFFRLAMLNLAHNVKSRLLVSIGERYCCLKEQGPILPWSTCPKRNFLGSGRNMEKASFLDFRMIGKLE
jgi:hypothetical protein